jgi:intracellular sulfur oxidation DsrE/DsrF family protein
MRIVLLLLLLFSAFAWAEEGAIDIVYHVNENKDPFVIMRNIRNHLNADPQAHIVVVTHGAGINFLLKGAANETGNLYEPEVQNLVLDGVDFRVCRNTLTMRGLDDSAVSEEAKVVPSGVAEVARLQKAGFVYLKP